MCHVTTAAQRLTAFNKASDDRANEAEAKMALNYLNAFGYLSKELSGWADISLSDVVNAIASFQDFFGLPITGQLNVQSVRTMEHYRCGMPDLIQPDHPSGQQYMRVKEFAEANLAAWQKRSLKYYIDMFVNGLDQSTQRAIIAQSFQDWENVAQINIEEASTPAGADIVIQADRGQRSNFDGPGGVLAWAYLPTGNDQQLLMKFDLDETWITDPKARGILMKNVATHEFGHLLGLDHSKVQTALMAPYYAIGVATPQANDDIPRIQARYGARSTPPVPPTVPPPVPPTVPPVGPAHTLVIEGATRILFDGRQVA